MTTDLREIPGARVPIDEDGRPVIEIATCGTCGASWNDAAISEITPTPAGRCPFEATEGAHWKPRCHCEGDGCFCDDWDPDPPVG